MSVATVSTPAPVPERAVDPATLFTCNSCGVGFATPDMQRRHMKTDWHRYNLKRRVASLPPISAEIFAERVIQQMDVSRKQEERLAYVQVCHVCGNKRFTSSGAYENHLSSARHRENLKRAEQLGITIDDSPALRDHSPEGSVATSTFSLGEPVEDSSYKTFMSFKDSRVSGGTKKAYRKQHKAPSVSSSVAQSVAPSVVSDEEDFSEAEAQDGEDENEDIDDIITRKLKNAVRLPITACIFCSATNFENVEANVAHMQRDHGLYLPEKTYLVDLEGLVTYLSEKVSIGNACLYCSFIGRSLNSARDHMIMKQHCKVPYDTEEERLELSNFYDFRSSYPDEEEEWEDEDSVAEDEDEETPNEQTAVVSRRQEGNLVLDSSGYELSLPMSGLRIGHRSLARYYRQSLRPTAELREGQGTVIAASSRQMLASPRDPVKARMDKAVWRDQNQKSSRNVQREMRYINQQKHFRDPMLQ